MLQLHKTPQFADIPLTLELGYGIYIISFNTQVEVNSTTSAAVAVEGDDFVLKQIINSLPPCQQQSRDCCQHTSWKGWWRWVNGPALPDECDLFSEADLGYSLPFIPTAAKPVLNPSQGCCSQMTVALLSKVLFVISSLQHLRPGSLTVIMANALHMCKINWGQNCHGHK